jgi:hypothetical protein
MLRANHGVGSKGRRFEAGETLACILVKAHLGSFKQDEDTWPRSRYLWGRLRLSITRICAILSSS